MSASDSHIPTKFPRQLSPRAVILGIVLSIVLAAANAYLGLFAGLTVSASIPAAVVSMAVLRIFRDVHVFEHNIVQTAASAGEAIAAGAIFTLPALVLMNYWSDFSPPWVIMICGIGGLLGVLFTVPLRHALIDEQKLPFPEGTATAMVLQLGEGGAARSSRRALLIGALVGALAKLGATGLRLWPESAGVTATAGRGVVYFGSSLSPALLAVGYIVGFNIAVLIFIGGMMAWGVAIPLYANFVEVPAGVSGSDLAWQLWSTRVRYLGVGAMLVGGLWALWSIRHALVAALKQVSMRTTDDTQRDLPRAFLLGMLLLLIVPMYLFYRQLLGSAAAAVPLTAIMLAAAFVFSAVAGYMAGLVGSSNNPISGVTIATILFTALALQWLVGVDSVGPVAAVLVGAVVCCAAAIGGDNLQDLKAGTVLGATPWKQQIAQMIGVVSAVFVLAPVLSLLMHAYGIGPPTAAHPHPLPAPQANLMAAVAQGVFGGSLPWPMVSAGAVLGVAIILCDEFQRRRDSSFRVPVLAVAVGIYLPLELSVPIALGGLLARVAGDGHGGAQGAGMLAAAGLITGEALMGIGLAIPIVLSGKPDVLALGWSWGVWPGLLLMLGLSVWLARLRSVRD